MNRMCYIGTATAGRKINYLCPERPPLAPSHRPKMQIASHSSPFGGGLNNLARVPQSDKELLRAARRELASTG